MVTRAQLLINKVKADLPIIVYPEREVLGKLRENFKEDTINLKTELEIHSMVNLGTEGGICCEIRTKGLDTTTAKVVFLSSITHFRIKRGQPYYQELEKYRKKRIRKLQRQNKNRFF